MSKALNVTVWNEFRHEQSKQQIRDIYPNGIHGAIADFLNNQEGIQAGTAIWTSRNMA